jgi:hypothetical protein
MPNNPKTRFARRCNNRENTGEIVKIYQKGPEKGQFTKKLPKMAKSYQKWLLPQILSITELLRALQPRPVWWV